MEKATYFVFAVFNRVETGSRKIFCKYVHLGHPARCGQCRYSNGLTLVNKWSPPTSEVDGADGPRAAGRGVARVGLLHAALRLADEAAGAVWVADTLGLAARDSVWK